MEQQSKMPEADVLLLIEAASLLGVCYEGAEVSGVYCE